MANIKEYLDKIKTAIYGKEVRGSIHDGIEAINKEVENTTNRQGILENRQDGLDNKFDEQIKNMTLEDPSSAELVDMRRDKDGHVYDLAGRRVDKIEELLQEKVNTIEPNLKTKNKNVVLAINEVFDKNTTVDLEGDSDKNYISRLKFKVTSSQSIGGNNENIKVSPNMGIKIV